MTKHGRNSTANPVYSYYERKRDSKESGFGTIEKRITGDSMQKVDYCSLTNQRCVNPVVTREGYLYDKEALLSFILKQKEQMRAKKKAYDLMILKKKIKDDGDKKEEVDKKYVDFLKSEAVAKSGVSKASKTQKPPSLHSLNSHLPCFWLPSLAPEAEETVQKPGSEAILCPFSGKKLKISQLIDVKFSRPQDDPTGLVCAASGDVLTTATPCAVLTTTGDVVTVQYVNKVIKSSGGNFMKCPFTGKKLLEKDVIQLKCGGSWHSSGSESHTARIVTPAMLIS